MIEISEKIDGVILTGKLVDLGHEGDPSVPGGMHHLGLTLEEVYITTDEPGVDITDIVAYDSEEAMIQIAIERYKDREGRP